MINDSINDNVFVNARSMANDQHQVHLTEHGRSEGVVLFSAEQFRSVIHDRIKGNCGTNVYGRTNAIEVSRPDYKFVPTVYADEKYGPKHHLLLLDNNVLNTKDLKSLVDDLCKAGFG